ncbi:MAG: ppiB [Ignavibacteria bacterium]|nr:ppiB [Ignavibacteria bacterium]
MNKSILLLLTILLSNSFLDAKDIIQITGARPHYLITVTQSSTTIGEMEIEMFNDVAPKHCRNFDSLVSIQFYNGTAFHRVIPNFMIQGGDPNSKNKPKSSWGTGDPSQTKVPAEFSKLSHKRSILSAARVGGDNNSATSQFFINVVDNAFLDGQYTIYGQVLSGMEVADIIVNAPRDAKDNPIEKVEMTIVKLESSGIEDFLIDNNKNITIYPSPVVDELKFKVRGESILIAYLGISDITGRTYFKENYSSGRNLVDLSIPVNSYSAGVYNIRIESNNGIVYDIPVIIQ